MATATKLLRKIVLMRPYPTLDSVILFDLRVNQTVLTSVCEIVDRMLGKDQ